MVEPTHATDAVGIITIVIQLIFLEGILSIDNAAVLGAMVSVLPTDQPVPYPAPLKPLQGFTNRYLGMQQSAALKVGLMGAYLGRALMLVLASWIIANPSLKILGAVYLIKLAFENLGKFAEHGAGDEDDDAEMTRLKRAGEVSFWGIVLNVELADLAFSLDNVVAAVALSDQLWVVMVGVALGIVTMRFAATAFTWMIKREPIMEQAAYIVVLNIGLELLIAEFFEVEITAWEKFAISLGTIVVCLVYAHVPALHVIRPILYWLANGMRLVNELIEWVFWLVVAVFKVIFQLVKKLLPVSKEKDESVVPSIERAVVQPKSTD